VLLGKVYCELDAMHHRVGVCQQPPQPLGHAMKANDQLKALAQCWEGTRPLVEVKDLFPYSLLSRRCNMTFSMRAIAQDC
jgi:hypothetical protein